MGLFDNEPDTQGLGLADNSPVAYNVDNPLFKIGLALQGFSSGVQGRPNPALEMLQTEMALRQRRDVLKQQQEKDKLNQEKEDFDQVSKMMDIMVKSGADPKEASKVFRQAIKTFPRLNTRFGDMIDNIELTGKEGEFEWKGYQAKEDITDATGTRWPAGKTYNVKGKMQGGKVVPTFVEDIEATKKEEKPPSVGVDREALAQELGFKDFNSAPADKKKEINTEVKRRQDEMAGLAASRENRLAGQFQQNMSLQQQREARLEEQQRRLLPSQQKALTGNRTAMKAIDDYAAGYDEFVKESQGATLSDIFRGAIAKNKNAQRAADLVTAEGRTPAERKLAAKYNALVGNIRNLTDEVGVLTDVDAVRILGSFDPALDRKQVKANLAERRKTHQRAYETAIEDYQAMGKDISKFIDVKPKGEAAQIMRGKSKSGKPIISKDGGKTWTYE